MAQAGRLTWVDLEIPQASSTTFATSGGFTSPGSTGADKGAQQARSGGIALGGVLSASQAQTIQRAGGTVSAAQIGGETPTGVSRDGGTEAQIALGGSKAVSAAKSGGQSAQVELSAEGSTIISKSGGIDEPVELGGDGAASFPTYQRARLTWLELEIPEAASTTFSVGGGISSPGKVGGDVDAELPEAPPGPISPNDLPGQIVRLRPRKPAPVKRRTQAQQFESIEAHAERLLDREELPEYFTVGAQKAYRNMQEFYGTADGKRIFMKKAIEQGHGTTLTEKINDVYATGTTVDQRKKLQTRVQTRGGNPQVKILSRIRQ